MIHLANKGVRIKLHSVIQTVHAVQSIFYVYILYSTRGLA
jgi:hypothetical protein